MKSIVAGPGLLARSVHLADRIVAIAVAAQSLSYAGYQIREQSSAPSLPVYARGIVGIPGRAAAVGAPRPGKIPIHRHVSGDDNDLP
jgi:hypothetical protein